MTYRINHVRNYPSKQHINIEGRFGSSYNLLPNFLDHLAFRFEMAGENLGKILLDFDLPQYYDCIFGVSIC